MSTTKEIFICYAREDEPLRKGLEKHLKALRRQNLIDVWHDREITAGTDWEREIDQHLNTAQIILLLVSPDFMDSDYCYGVEMKRAMERHERGEAQVIPIILRYVYWQKAPFGKLQALPSDAKPVNSWHDQDQAFFDVTEGIRKALEELAPQITAVFPETPADVSKQMPSETTEDILALSPEKPTILPQDYSLKRTLSGFLYAVLSLAISPLGNLLISGGLDPTLVLWDVKTGKLIQTLEGHSDGAWSVAFSPDGLMFASGGQDKTIKLWNVQTAYRIHTLKGHSLPIRSLAINREGKLLVSGSWDGLIKVWNVKTGKLIRTLEGHSGAVMSVDISPNGQVLASGSTDQTIKVWNLYTGDLFRTIKEDHIAVGATAISPDGEVVASGGASGTVKIWNIHTGKLIRILGGHTDRITCIVFSPDGQTLFSGSTDRTIKAWELHTGELLYTLKEHLDIVNSIAISQDRQILACGTGGNDKKIYIWEKQQDV